MTNINTIQRQLVHIDPLFKPTPSVLLLVDAVSFVEAQLAEKNVEISQLVSDRFLTVKAITRHDVWERPSQCFDSIRLALAELKLEVPQTEELLTVAVPGDTDAMRFVTTVEKLANTLLGFIRGLDLLPEKNSQE